MSNEKSAKLVECGNAPGKQKGESKDYLNFDLKRGFTIKAGLRGDGVRKDEGVGCSWNIWLSVAEYWEKTEARPWNTPSY